VSNLTHNQNTASLTPVNKFDALAQVIEFIVNYACIQSEHGRVCLKV
jgi:hypothetical protein